MVNFYELIKSIYTKSEIRFTGDIGTSIALTKVLSKETGNLHSLRRVVDYLFYLSPQHYFFLLFLTLPRRAYVPKSIKVERTEQKEDKLFLKIKDYFGWTDREYRQYLPLLNKVIEKDRTEWKQKLGISR